jgi:hypothetical protein
MTIPPPLLVQPLSYESDRENPWLPIIRAIGIAGLVLGTGRILQLIYALGYLSLYVMRTFPGTSPYNVINGVSQLATALTGIFLLAGSIQFLRLRNATQVMFWSSSAMIFFGILGGVASAILYTSPWGRGGPGNPPIVYFSAFSMMLSPAIGSAFPLFLAIVLKSSARDPRYQAAFAR